MIVNDLPKFLDPIPNNTSHSILCLLHNHDNKTLVQMVVLVLQLKGMTLFLKLGRPTAEEWTSVVHLCLVLTSEHLTWGSHDNSYEQQEEGMTDLMGSRCPAQGDRLHIIHVINMSRPTGSLYTLEEITMCDMLDTKVVVTSVDENSPLAQWHLLHMGTQTG